MGMAVGWWLWADAGEMSPSCPKHEIGPQAERTCLQTRSLMRDVQEVMAEVGAKSRAPEHPSGTHLDDSSSLKMLLWWCFFVLFCFHENKPEV